MSTNIALPLIKIRAFFTQYRTLKLLFLAALLFDTVSTIHFMLIDGTTYELHPIVRFSAIALGPVLGTFLGSFAFKAIAGFILEAMYLKRYAVYMYAAAICTSTFAGFYNFLSVA
ncbi:MAG: hypothetical protein ACYTER_09340 [Planctomycetota bacterium]|jgi:hypothetical protein